MKALTYQGANDVRVENVPDPVLKEADDNLIRRELVSSRLPH